VTAPDGDRPRRLDLRVRPPQTPFTERLALGSVRYLEAVSMGWYRAAARGVGGSIYGAPVLLLTASGRVSGRRRTKPLLSLEDGDGWIVVGSRGGMAGHPEWYLNLLAYEADPEAPHLEPPEVEVAGRTPVTVRTTQMEGAERELWWKRLVSVYPRFADYQVRATERVIPIARLSPRS
jgi:deazaflavin-dependent oxidoreductase (nitroreductase family)